MRTILVSGASGIVGYGILKSLRGSGSNLRLIGTSIYDDSAAPSFCDIFELAPRTDDVRYFPWLKHIIDRHRVDLIIPGIELDLYTWTCYENDIRETGVRIALNNRDLIALCQDKWLFYQHLAAAGDPCRIETLLHGEYDELAERLGIPFLLKPRRGFASKGIVRVNDRDEFMRHQPEIGLVLMIQPIVGDDDHEFSTSAFCDGRGGVCATMTLKRKLSKDGFTEKAEVVFQDKIDEAIGRLAGHLLPDGPTNFQFRCQDGVFKLLEINPRISSATSIRTAFGFNESQMAVDYFLDQKLPLQPPIRAGRAIRYTEDAIFYQ
jgi:carbamoyl-phosphate synthase large subunit